MDLRSRLLSWMCGGREDFAAMAREVFRYQFDKNESYRNYCRALGKLPETVLSWQEIPAVPTDVFKLPGAALRCFSEEEVSGHFLTSGTTTDTKGKHEFRDLSLYKASAMAQMAATLKRRNFPANQPAYLFSQPPSEAPHSSLVRMFGWLAPEGKWLIDRDGNLDLGKFQPTSPAAIFGTSIALLRVCDEMPSLVLPEDSWFFETGGNKGLRKSFTPIEVRTRLSKHFHVPESNILNEYGMTELFSQFYKWGDEKTHKGPPWVAVRVVDVKSGQLAEEGEIGYLEIIDLANLDTVSAIRTQDLAIAAGERNFVLIGRDPSAVARGCSRGVEELMEG